MTPLIFLHLQMALELTDRFILYNTLFGIVI